MTARRSKTEEQIAPELPPQQSIELLRRCASETDALSQLSHDDPQVNVWENFTEQVIIKAFGKPHENLNAFHFAKIGGPVRFGMSDREVQRNHLNAMKNLGPLLLGFAKQLEAFTPQVAVVATSAQQAKAVTDRIFIVHGHADKPKIELALMLTRLGLDPVILHEQPNQGMTLIEKLEKHSEVGYAFILLTPDDVGCEIGHLKGDWMFTRRALQPRARQNVVFEFGRFIGLLGRDRVCCLYAGKVEPPSDVQGLVYIPFKSSVSEVQVEIVKELRAAGYEVKI